MAEIIRDESGMFDKDGAFWKQQLDASLFKERIRREVKKMVEEEERAGVAPDMSTRLRLAYDPMPTAEPELIPGLLPEAGITAVVGETNCGKSALGLEIASSLLTGEPLWGAINPTRRIDKVVYILSEHTAPTLQGLYHRMGLPHDGQLLILSPEELHPHKALVINGVSQPIAIERLLRWTEGAGLIVFDPLAGFVQGQAAENDNSAMRTLIDSMSLIAQKNKAACLVLAHAGKPALDPASGAEVRRTSYVSRGATAIEDSMSHIFYLRKSIAVKQQKDASEKYDLVTRKVKGVQSTELFRLSRNPDTIRNTLMNTKEVKGVYPSLEERKELQERVNRTLINNPGFTMDTAMKVVADGAGMPEGTLKRWLTEN